MHDFLSTDPPRSPYYTFRRDQWRYSGRKKWTAAECNVCPAPWRRWSCRAASGGRKSCENNGEENALHYSCIARHIFRWERGVMRCFMLYIITWYMRTSLALSYGDGAVDVGVDCVAYAVPAVHCALCTHTNILQIPDVDTFICEWKRKIVLQCGMNFFFAVIKVFFVVASHPSQSVCAT